MICSHMILLLLTLCVYDSLTYMPEDSNVASAGFENVTVQRSRRDLYEPQKGKFRNVIVPMLFSIGGQTMDSLYRMVTSRLASPGSPVATVTKTAQFCVIDIKTLDDCHPLIFESETNLNNLYQPNNMGYIFLLEGQTVYVSCNKKVPLVYKPNDKATKLSAFSTTVKCESFKDNTFSSPEVRGTFHYPQLQCAQPTIYEVFRETDRQFSVGFSIDKSKTVKIISGTVNPDLGITDFVATKHTSLKPENKQPIYEFHEWNETNYKDLMNVKVDSCVYKKQLQEQAVENLLECEESTDKELVRKSCDCETDFCPYQVVRTPLAPSTSFVYQAESAATSVYLNAAPMMAYVRKGNWQAVEDQVAAMVQSEHYAGSFVTVTGVYKTLKWPSLDTVEKPRRSTNRTYLNNEMVPCEEEPHNEALTMDIPKYFWKIVIHQLSKNSIVFIVSNNPFLQQEDYEDNRLCKSYEDNFENASIGRVHKQLNNKNPRRGYVHACPVDEFIRTVAEDIPALRELQDIAQRETTFGNECKANNDYNPKKFDSIKMIPIEPVKMNFM